MTAQPTTTLTWPVTIDVPQQTMTTKDIAPLIPKVVGQENTLCEVVGCTQCRLHDTDAEQPFID